MKLVGNRNMINEGLNGMTSNKNPGWRLTPCISSYPLAEILQKTIQTTIIEGSAYRVCCGGYDNLTTGGE